MPSTATPLTPARRPEIPPVGVVLGLLTDSVAHRAELAGLELAEARDHAGGSALLAGVAAVLALLTGFAFTLLIAGLVWDGPHRGWWLGGLCAGYLAAALLAAFKLRQRLLGWEPLGETHRQLQEDYQCLHQLIKSTAS